MHTVLVMPLLEISQPNSYPDNISPYLIRVVNKHSQVVFEGITTPDSRVTRIIVVPDKYAIHVSRMVNRSFVIHIDMTQKDLGYVELRTPVSFSSVHESLIEAHALGLIDGRKKQSKHQDLSIDPDNDQGIYMQVFSDDGRLLQNILEDASQLLLSSHTVIKFNLAYVRWIRIFRHNGFSEVTAIPKEAEWIEIIVDWELCAKSTNLLGVKIRLLPPHYEFLLYLIANNQIDDAKRLTEMHDDHFKWQKYDRIWNVLNYYIQMRIKIEDQNPEDLDGSIDKLKSYQDLVTKDFFNENEDGYIGFFDNPVMLDAYIALCSDQFLRGGSTGRLKAAILLFYFAQYAPNGNISYKYPLPAFTEGLILLRDILTDLLYIDSPLEDNSLHEALESLRLYYQPYFNNIDLNKPYTSFRGSSPINPGQHDGVDLGAGTLEAMRRRQPMRARNLRMQGVSTGNSKSNRRSKRLSSLPTDLSQNSRGELIYSTRPPGHMHLERLLGGMNDLLDVSYLDRGRAAAKAVGRLVLRDKQGRATGFGTASLCGPQLLLTSHQVLDTAQAAITAVVEFGYELGPDGVLQDRTVMNLDPDALFLTSEALDYTLVAIADDTSRFNWLKFNGKVMIGEDLSILQHPAGEPKQMALRMYQVVERTPRGLWYSLPEGATLPPSGSPVFDDSWCMVALHSHGIARTDVEGRPLCSDGLPFQPGDPESRIDWIRLEGVPVRTIVEDVTVRNIMAREAGHSNSRLDVWLDMVK